MTYNFIIFGLNEIFFSDSFVIASFEILFISHIANNFKKE